MNSNLVLKKVFIAPTVENFKNKAPISKVSSNKYRNYSWRILIPQINLDAPILEGTDKEVLRKGVGHFQNTGLESR